MPEKPVVTDELLANVSKADPVADAEHEAREAWYQRNAARYHALDRAVQLETARNLTEDPEDVTKRILSRCASFYDYLITDTGEEF